MKEPGVMQDKTNQTINQEINKSESIHANGGTGNFNLDTDPDRPKGAINSSVIIEEIDINGAI